MPGRLELNDANCSCVLSSSSAAIKKASLLTFYICIQTDGSASENRKVPALAAEKQPSNIVCSMHHITARIPKELWYSGSNMRGAREK